MSNLMHASGMSRNSGALLNADEHLRQSIHDILTTPLGTRLMRREYGSLLPFLIDAPANDATRLRLMAATATALIRWEPRVKVSKVTLAIINDGINSGWETLIEMRRSDSSTLTTSLSLVRGAT
ncbi:GPW/gp25 family protein [Psychrobacter sp. 72-O-c]|uniref:GPW/gp25 family protein n=1 Tax=Psychrobacter sp. 72-O-c TaxID=2774125 RepID=UPI001D121368|nr:GPW/gp25 family protein [Psychrobacter sp. 72-O-c]